MDQNKIKHCEKCNKTFNSNAHYLIHCETEIHKTGQRKIRNDKKENIKCNICNLYTSRHSTNMKLHILNNHTSIEDKKKNFKFYCATCDYGVINERKYNEHLETTKHKIKIVKPIN